MAKRVSIDNYRDDPVYPRIVAAAERVLARHSYIAPVDLFVELGLLQPADVLAWRNGRVPCLERVVRCNLSHASKILRILRLHAHDLDMKPSITLYTQWGARRPRPRLRFSKSGELAIEEAYSRHFLPPTCCTTAPALKPKPVLGTANVVSDKGYSTPR